jgi:3-hydroxy-3-methylglutaryl CoA synthase
MNVDVLIYVNNLKDFFKKDKQAFKDMFGALDIDKELYFKRLEEIANQNFEEKGEPTLSTIQMWDIVKELVAHTDNVKQLTKLTKKDPTNPFVKFRDDFPPYCLN